MSIIRYLPIDVLVRDVFTEVLQADPGALDLIIAPDATLSDNILDTAFPYLRPQLMGETKDAESDVDKVS
jgi:hypothetical protein